MKPIQNKNINPSVTSMGFFWSFSSLSLGFSQNVPTRINDILACLSGATMGQPCSPGIYGCGMISKKVKHR